MLFTLAPVTLKEWVKRKRENSWNPNEPNTVAVIYMYVDCIYSTCMYIPARHKLMKLQKWIFQRHHLLWDVSWAWWIWFYFCKRNKQFFQAFVHMYIHLHNNISQINNKINLVPFFVPFLLTIPVFHYSVQVILSRGFSSF